MQRKMIIFPGVSSAGLRAQGSVPRAQVAELRAQITEPRAQGRPLVKAPLQEATQRKSPPPEGFGVGKIKN